MAPFKLDQLLLYLTAQDSREESRAGDAWGIGKERRRGGGGGSSLHKTAERIHVLVMHEGSGMGIGKTRGGGGGGEGVRGCPDGTLL